MADNNILQLMQYVTDQGDAGRKSGLQELLGRAYSAPAADRQNILATVAARGEPGMAVDAQKQFSAQDDDIHDRIIQRAGMVAALWKTNPQMAQAAYQGMPQMAAQAGFGQVPRQLDANVASALENMSKLALSGKQDKGVEGVQSTYIDNNGQRVAVMRDGTKQVLGQNAPSTQIIDTGNGFVGVNKGNLTAAPVMLGGQPAPQAAAPQPAPGEVPFSIDPSLPPDVQARIRADPQAGSASGITAPINAGQQGQQLRSVPKPKAASALEDRIATARRMGASDDDIKRMVLGGSANGGAGDDLAETIAQGIQNGDQPPVTTGLYKYGAPVRAALEKRGFNLTKANQDYVATQKLYATLNGSQQVRLREAVGMVKESIPLVRSLAQEWDAGGYPALNKMTLAAAKQGLMGPKAASLATRLDTQIADMTGEIGTVTMGGNSPTDHSLALAAKQMDGNWSKQTFMDSLDQTEKNITYRENSIKNLGTSGIESSQYNQGNPTQALGGNPATGKMSKDEALQHLQDARDAIKAGANKEAVRQRMIQMGLPQLAGRL